MKWNFGPMAWHFLSYIPRGQSWVFREMGKMGVLLSPYFPVALFPCCVCSPMLALGRTQTISSGPGLWLFTRVSILCPLCWALQGWGAVLKPQSQCWRGEEFYFSEGLSGTSPCCFVTFLREHPETSFISVYHHRLYKAVVKHPLLGSWLSDK